MFAVWAAVVKKLLQSANLAVPHLLYKPFLTLGETHYDHIRVWYKKTGVDTPADVLMDCTVDISIEDVVIWLCDTGRPWNNRGYSELNNFVLQRIEFEPLIYQTDVGTPWDMRHARYTKLDLENVTVSLSSKSAIKMQNRTVEEAGDDENEVNNIPLYGKSFTGAGTGPQRKDQYGEQNTFVVNQTTGVIIVPENIQMREPPPPEEFNRVKMVGKVKIEPGEIKTSVLSASATHKFNIWYRGFVRSWMVQSSGTPPASQKFPDYAEGNYRTFFIEKMLAVGSASIKTAYEVQNNMTSFAKVTYPSNTVQYHFQQTLA